MIPSIKGSYKELRQLYLSRLSPPQMRRYLSRSDWIAEDVYTDLKKAKRWLEKTSGLSEYLKANGLPIRRVWQGFEGYVPTGKEGCFVPVSEREAFERSNPQSAIEVDEDKLESTIPHLETLFPESEEENRVSKSRRWEIKKMYDTRLLDSKKEPYRYGIIYTEHKGPVCPWALDYHEHKLGRLIIIPFDENLPEEFKKEIVILD